MLEKSTLSVKKVLPFTERVFSQPYIQLKILTISFTLSKQVFQKIILSFSSFTFTCIWCILQKIDMLIRIIIRICANLMIVI